jgi:hypothetical protein
LYKNTPVTTCSVPNKNNIIAAAVKAAITVKVGKIIEDIESPMAIAPTPICKALIQAGDFILVILVALI